MKTEKITESVEIPEKTEVRVEGSAVIVKGQKGELTRNFRNPQVKIYVEGNRVIFESRKATKREKTIIGSCIAHLKNMLRGANEKHVYKLKICSGHFPMNVSMAGDVFTIKNFIGEKVPRTLNLKKGADVKIQGNEVIVESSDKEIASQTAADIEQLTRRTGYDRRIFQDGIYIFIKDGKEIT